MAKAKNKVIAGDYNGKLIISVYSNAKIVIGLFKKDIELNKDTIESYELITDEHRKSAVSGVARGLVGGALLGPVGLLAGLSAKNKGIYQVAIQFKDGKRSLIEVDDKIYNAIIQSCF